MVQLRIAATAIADAKNWINRSKTTKRWRIMKKGSIFVCLLTLLMFSCTNRNVSVTISGDIKNGGNKMMRLALITADGMDIIDSTNLKDGKFEFKISSEDERIK